MRTSPAGRAAIESREGLRLTSYRDAVGVLTIGFGHTSRAGPPEVTPGLAISREEASAILARDLVAFEEAVVLGLGVPVEPHEFDALVSLCYNIGPGNFRRSTVLRRLNRTDRAGAADAFLAWNRAGGRVLPGLARRRAAERAQFLGGQSTRSTAAPDRPDPSPSQPARATGGLLAALRRITGRA